MRRSDIEAVISLADGSPVLVRTNLDLEGDFIRFETRRDNYGAKWRFNTYVILKNETQEHAVSIRNVNWVSVRANRTA